MGSGDVNRYRPKKLYVRRALRRSVKFRQWFEGWMRRPIEYASGNRRGIVSLIEGR